ncbi:protein DpdE [Microbacterium sp. CPCC 204701]|uniref:protein DpdE n=1 Tax=Microbacterium sp. CPCC 204701 TaxID=2493084 RepID=UPI000FDC5DBF|nr:protein DpdE [Microbacterium sp. CPCC 204701]
MRVGSFVTFAGAPGIGRVGQTEDSQVRVDFFESAAEPRAESVWKPISLVRRVQLEEETRVFFRDGDERWRAGRVIGARDGFYYVKVPNVDGRVEIDERHLYTRWDKTPRDPLQVLLSGANETPRYRDAREPVRRLLLEERAATASATGIMSAGVRIHAHQVSAALRIIRDPVQRYLLADEVGMGKTIQAGLVMRQLLIDQPGRRIGLIVPDALMAQWRSELRGKFHLDDFPTGRGGSPYEILGHSEVSRWHDLQDVELLVVDEAHLLANTNSPDTRPYAELARLAHAAPRVLMLSATPFARSATTHLALLHLLDPQLFRWEEREHFEQLLSARRELAFAVFGLDPDPDPDNPELLELQFDEIRSLIPGDEVLREAMARAMAVFERNGDVTQQVDEDALRTAVETVRTHISETYRLHHRVIRNRRHEIARQKLDDDGLLTPFEFTGRTRPKAIRLEESMEDTAGARAVADWAAGCAAAILDDSIDAALYGHVLGVLASRVGGPVNDLVAILEYRHGAALDDSALDPVERAILNAAPVHEFESHVLDQLKALSISDGLGALVGAFVGRMNSTSRAVVFCGRGSLAENLVGAVRNASGWASRVHAHVSDQTEAQREHAVFQWRTSGGLLVVDESGEVGKNFQDAAFVFHARMPWSPNALEQRIGRVDRYGDSAPAQQYVVVAGERGEILDSWLRLLASGFEIFSNSISALQEAADEIALDTWAACATDGVEAFLERSDGIRNQLQKERSRINELDALESSFGTHSDGESIAASIARYEESPRDLEDAYLRLVTSAEGFRLTASRDKGGTLTFGRDPMEQPLFSPRLLARLMSVDAARTGSFDRWRLHPGERLFRRGNPFVDGIESLLNLDDRGQAVAMWRLDPRWPNDPFTFFGFDFLIEADLDPMLQVLEGDPIVEPVARRRADAAFPPQRRRVWVPVNTQEPITSLNFIAYLDRPFELGPDQNLNYKRIPALHSILGGEQNLAPIATACFEAAQRYVVALDDVTVVSEQAALKVRRETEIVIAQSRARAQATGLVGDPSALEFEVAIGQALEAGVVSPVIRLSGVTCVVVSAQPWGAYVER